MASMSENPDRDRIAADERRVGELLRAVEAPAPTATTVVRVSKVALARPTANAPVTLVAAGTTIAFPNWAHRGWPSTGLRSDRLGGRAVTTEFYRSYEAGTLGYAIVSGAPLDWGGAGSSVVLSGEHYVLIRSGGAQLVSWVQQGHTCVLASRTASAKTLLALAVAQERGVPA